MTNSGKQPDSRNNKKKRTNPCRVTIHIDKTKIQKKKNYKRDENKNKNNNALGIIVDMYF